MKFSLADKFRAALKAARPIATAPVRQNEQDDTRAQASWLNEVVSNLKANESVENCFASIMGHDDLRLTWSYRDSRLDLSSDGCVLRWNQDYLYDFPGQLSKSVQEIVAFLDDFFDEKILVGKRANGSGGPIWTQEAVPEETIAWFAEPGTLIRSWRGNYDTTVTTETTFPWLRTIRLLQPSEVPEVAAFYIDIQADTVPSIHPLHEVIDYITNVRLPQGSSYVLEQNGKILGWVDFADGWVNHLYVRRGETGKGIGKQLLTYAKFKNPKGLQLWTFQINEKARRFYQREGFHEVELTKGEGNEEKQPDVRLEWRKV